VAFAVVDDVSPLAPVTGAGLLVPLVRGGEARYANLDYAASAPALAAVLAYRVFNLAVVAAPALIAHRQLGRLLRRADQTPSRVSDR